MTTEQGVLLHITIFVETERAAEFFEHFKPVYDAVIAEPECTLFEVSIDSNTEPGITRIRFLEGWAASENWLMTVGCYSELLLAAPSYSHRLRRIGANCQGILSTLCCGY